MMEKQLRINRGLSAASLCLGILGILTSAPLLINGWDLFELRWEVFPSQGFGLLGVIAGSLSLDGRTGQKWQGIVGIVLSILPLLPILFLFVVSMLIVMFGM